MESTSLPRGWQVRGASVQGAAHVRHGKPNQDAIDWWPEEGEGATVVLTVCDGHGSQQSFRSKRGAHLAAQVGLEIAQDLIRMQTESMSTGGRHGFQDELGRTLVKRWLAMVDAELEHDPITPEELATLEAIEGQSRRKEVEDNPKLAFGSTSLGLVITESALACWQLGDGDIVAVGGGRVWRPLPADERLIANATFSLCSAEAWRYVRAELLPLNGSSLELILLATDGLSNSFADDSGFLKFSEDLADRIDTDGLSQVAGHLETWLHQISEKGGDDVTVGIVCPAPDLRHSPDEEGGVVQGPTDQGVGGPVGAEQADGRD